MPVMAVILNFMMLTKLKKNKLFLHSILLLFIILHIGMFMRHVDQPNNTLIEGKKQEFRKFQSQVKRLEKLIYENMVSVENFTLIRRYVSELSNWREEDAGKDEVLDDFMQQACMLVNELIEKVWQQTVFDVMGISLEGQCYHEQDDDVATCILTSLNHFLEEEHLNGIRKKVSQRISEEKSHWDFTKARRWELAIQRLEDFVNVNRTPHQLRVYCEAASRYIKFVRVWNSGGNFCRIRLTDAQPLLGDKAEQSIRV